MRRIEDHKVWGFFDDETKEAKELAPDRVRKGFGHTVESYLDLAARIAHLQYHNPDYVLLFRGQGTDYKSKDGFSLLKASIFRLASERRLPTEEMIEKRFKRLERAERALLDIYLQSGLPDEQDLRRYRILRWAILQHYEICLTPLLDVTQSLRIAAAFACLNNRSTQGYVYAFGVPNISGGITTSAEAGLQIVRLASACPPSASRPHLQEGFLLAQYPDISTTTQSLEYKYLEMDFGRRLIAKFKLNPQSFWGSNTFMLRMRTEIYPEPSLDPLCAVADAVRSAIGRPPTE